MRTLNGPGVMPRIRRYAERRGITVQQALADREMAALSLFTEACERVVTNQDISQERLDAYRSATEDGLLPAMTGEARHA